MRLILTVELGSIVVLALASLVVHLAGRRPAGRLARLTWWQLSAVFTVTAIEAATLLVVLHRVNWPWWVFAAVYGAVTAVMAGWLVLRWHTRGRDRTSR